MTKYIHITLGTISVVLGVAGIFLPLLPTTPFLLLAAACYIKGSQKLYEWLINHKILGRYIKSYLDGEGIPLRSKIFSISLMWLFMAISGIFFVDITFVRIILVIIGICVTWHISSIKTKKPKTEKSEKNQ